MGNRNSHISRSASFSSYDKNSTSRSPNTDARDTNKAVLIALYDYESRTENELSFQKGDQMTLLDRSIPDWWLVKKRKNGEHGYVPRNYVAKLVDDESEEWYAGRMPRNRATNAVTVSHLPKGAFLIRERELNPNEFALTVRDIDEQGKATAKHYKIKRNRDGRFYITPSRMFESLRHLVIHYETQADGLCCQLTSAVPRIAPTRPELSHLTRDNWEIPKEQIRLEKMIGSGNFGQVWHGYWRDIIEVAVKTMKPGSMLATEFLAEATIMKKFDHLNLVKLYAVCTKEEPFYIVTEYMVNGSLLNYLQNDGRNLSNTALLDMCAQVASGMTYLESKKLVHRDLAARNVLVGDFFNGSLIVKIADFGLARWLREDYVYEARVATMFPVKWTAPEAARMGNFTIKSDVWSYGVLIFEVTSHGGSPYSDFDTKEVIAKVESGYRLPKPADCPQRIYDDIMLECWNQEPTRRPTFASISRYFDKFFNYDPMFS